MNDLFGEQPLRVAHPAAYARTPGTGPAGCTCDDCQHLFKRIGQTGRHYYKCRRADHDKTADTDVRISMPACAAFSAREG